jgi:hypothetical protein
MQRASRIMIVLLCNHLIFLPTPLPSGCSQILNYAPKTLIMLPNLELCSQIFNCAAKFLIMLPNLSLFSQIFNYARKSLIMLQTRRSSKSYNFNPEFFTRDGTLPMFRLLKLTRKTPSSVVRVECRVSWGAETLFGTPHTL